MLTRLLSVRTDDDDVHFRGQLLKGAAAFVGLAALISLLSLLPSNPGPATIAINLGFVAVSVPVFGLVHYGKVSLGGLFLAVGLLSIIAYSRLLSGGGTQVDVASYVIPVLIAGLAVGSPGVLALSALVVLAMAVVAAVHDSFGTTLSLPVLLTFGLTAAIAWLLVRTLERAVSVARQQTVTALAAQQELTSQQERMREANVELTEANRQMTTLLELVRDLETPVIPLLDGVLVLPLVGHIDTRRAGQLTDSVLNAVHNQRAHLLVMDITGVSVIDTAVAQRLAQLAQAVQLLGARVMLTGIRAETAQTMVTQGIDFRNIETAGRLQDGLNGVLSAPSYA